MTKAELKQQIHRAIDQRAEEIIGLGETIRRHPELGFKEVKTARLVEETLGRSRALAPRADSPSPASAPIWPVAAATARPSRCSASSTRSSSPAIPMPIRRPAPRTPAATTRRWPGCWARPWVCSTPRPSSTWPDAWCSSRCPPRSTATSSGAWGRPGPGGSSSSGASPSCCAWATSTTSTWPMMIHLTLAPGGRQGRRARLQQRLHREDRALRRQGRPRGRRAPPRRQRALRRARSGSAPSTRSARRSATRTRSACTRSSPTAASQVNVIPGEVRLETYVRGRSVEAILDANAQGRPRVQGRRPRAGRHRSRSRRLPGLPAACVRSHMARLLQGQRRRAASATSTTARSGTAPAPPTWATSARSCRSSTRTWAGRPAPATAPTTPSSTRRSPTWTGQGARLDGGRHAGRRRDGRARGARVTPGPR